MPDAAQTSSSDALQLLRAYLQERVSSHPLLAPCLPQAAICTTGSVALGSWDEQSLLDVQLIVPDTAHAQLAASLQSAGLWTPARDFRTVLNDREPFRRFPGARLLIYSATQLRQLFAFDLPVLLWTYRHAALLQDPLDTLRRLLDAAEADFAARLDALRCEHYYHFRQARTDLRPRFTPGRHNTVRAIKVGEAAREALRLAFLAEGKPYPYDKWLEVQAERETACGTDIVDAVRALLAATEEETLEHAGKVLRDRVALALMQSGVREPWLEQWWQWPFIAPGLSSC